MFRFPKDKFGYLLLALYFSILIIAAMNDSPEALVPISIGMTSVAIFFFIGGYVLRRLDKNSYCRKKGFGNQLKKLKDKSYSYICQTLGRGYANKIHSGGKIIDDEGLSLCKKILNDEEQISDLKLKFYILIEVARFSIIQFQFVQAKSYLLRALEIEPKNTIALLRLAEANEFSGDKENAINTYRELKLINNDNLHIKNYVDLQIERINQHGLKKPGPIGLKYMSY